MSNSTSAAATGTAPVPKLAVLLATSLGLGYSRFAPGTMGSLAGVALFTPVPYLLPDGWQLPGYGVLLAAVLWLSFWSTAAALPKWGGDDPQAIVVDEVAGQFLTFAGPVALSFFNETTNLAGWPLLLAGFLLFRLFDIWKPGPVRRVELLPQPASIVYDDLVAGILASVVLVGLAAAGWL